MPPGTATCDNALGAMPTHPMAQPLEWSNL